MSEETNNTTAPEGATERVGFCQDCGRPLTRETIRQVGNGTFCEACLARRIGAPMPGATVPPPPFASPVSEAAASAAAGAGSGTAGAASSSNAWNRVHAPTPPPAGFVPAVPHLPNPTLAGILGIIPGVGAMYNGQLVKGLIHLAIFAVLVTMENNVSGVFGMFVAAWEVYQIFEAWHTAKAKREGAPVPDFLGLNELANRLGPVHTWMPQNPAGQNPVGYGAQGAPPPAGTAAGAGSPAEAAGATPYVPAAGATPAAGYAGYAVPPANWAGYVHPSAFAAGSPAAGAGSVPAPVATPLGEQIRQQMVRDAVAGTGYAETYAGETAGPALTPLMTEAPKRRFPMGALWLIAAGVLVLTGNLSSEWRISSLWVLAGLFATLAVWTLVRRVEYAGGYDAVRDGEWPRVVCSLRGPVMLLTLAVLFVLQAARVATFGQTWAVLPIVFGVMLVLERTVGTSGVANLPVAAAPGYGAGYAPSGGVAGYPASAPADATGAESAPAKDVRP